MSTRMTAAIHDLGGAWPFPAVSKAWMAKSPDWFEISEEHYWHFLEVLPPIYFPGGFMVSETYDHDERDVPCYMAVVTTRGRHFMRICARDKAEAARADLVAALGATAQSL